MGNGRYSKRKRDRSNGFRFTTAMEQTQSRRDAHCLIVLFYCTVYNPEITCSGLVEAFLCRKLTITQSLKQFFDRSRGTRWSTEGPAEAEWIKKGRRLLFSFTSEATLFENDPIQHITNLKFPRVLLSSRMSLNGRVI